MNNSSPSSSGVRSSTRLVLSRVLLTLALLTSAAALPGCGLFGIGEPAKTSDSTPPVIPGSDTTPAIKRGNKPSFAEAAQAYNQRVKLLDRVSARANILLTYYDDEGNQRTEDPEGRLQIVRPSKMALNLGKAGQIVFWIGCDPEQYWWIDLSEQGKRLVAVGRHEKFSDQTAQRIGLPIKPLDIIRLVGVNPIEIANPGDTQWSNDATLLGISSAIGDRGFQRIWVDPKTYQARIIEIFDRARQKVLVAEHEGSEPVTFTRDIPGASIARMRLPSRVLITHIDSGTTARLTLSDVKDGPISDKAFDLKVLIEKYPVDKFIDLDAKPAPTPRLSSGTR